MGAVRVTALYTNPENGKVTVLVDGKPVHETFSLAPREAKAMFADVFRAMALGNIIVSDGETEENVE